MEGNKVLFQNHLKFSFIKSNLENRLNSVLK